MCHRLRWKVKAGQEDIVTVQKEMQGATHATDKWLRAEHKDTDVHIFNFLTHEHIIRLRCMRSCAMPPWMSYETLQQEVVVYRLYMYELSISEKCKHKAVPWMLPSITNSEGSCLLKQTLAPKRWRQITWCLRPFISFNQIMWLEHLYLLSTTKAINLKKLLYSKNAI